MTTFTTKLAALAIAATAVAFSPLTSSDALAKPMGGMGGGGFKMGGFGGFKPGPIGPIGKGPVLGGPIKIGSPLKPIGPFKPFPPIKVGPIKPLPPICKFPGCGPKPPHHHHGKFWVLGGITILASAYQGCGYEYYKWKSTGSPFWYAKYAECRGWE